jgi:hypothetical protein
MFGFSFLSAAKAVVPLDGARMNVPWWRARLPFGREEEHRQQQGQSERQNSKQGSEAADPARVLRS